MSLTNSKMSTSEETKKLRSHISLSTVEFSSYTAPAETEKSREGFVEYGEDNDYFNHLIGLYNDSPTNNAVINGMIEQIYGQGLSIQGQEISSKEVDELRKTIKPEQLRRIVQDLKMLGQAAAYIIKKGNVLHEIKHFPIETLRPTPLGEGETEVTSYKYHPNWEDYQQRDTLKEIKAFGHGGAGEDEILWIKPYRAGSFYFAPVDYKGGLQYCEVEREVANYHINNIKNGFTAGALINFNNGALMEDEEQQIAIENRIKEKFAGTSNAGKFILAFNPDKESAATVDTLSQEAAHNQYEFIAAEAQEKILVSHRVTSPMLLGIKDNTGLGNNADELKTAYHLFEATVVNVFRILLTENLRLILDAYDKDRDIYFVPLALTQEPEAEEAPEAPTEEVEEVQPTGDIELSSQRPVLSSLDEQAMLINMIGLGEEENALDDEYELIDVDWSDDEDTDADLEAMLNAGDIMLDANADSSQDSPKFKVRYMYRSTSSDKPSGDSRPLCKTLMSKGLIYRKEDIKAISSKGGAEANGQSYDVFLHKGGANCQHGWERQIYMKRTKKDGSPWGGGAMNGVKRSKVYQAIKGKAKINKAADKKAYTAPRDTPTKGYKK